MRSPWIGFIHCLPGESRERKWNNNNAVGSVILGKTRSDMLACLAISEIHVSSRKFVTRKVPSETVRVSAEGALHPADRPPVLLMRANLIYASCLVVPLKALLGQVWEGHVHSSGTCAAMRTVHENQPY